MTKAGMKALIHSAVSEKKLIGLNFRFDENTNYYGIPLASNDKLFLVADEEDFILNGFTIYRFKDLVKTSISKKYNEMLRSEVDFDTIKTPKMNISSWQMVFESLKQTEDIIIVEKNVADEDERDFIIGRIEEIYKKTVYVRYFNAEGIWDEELDRIPYSEITNVTFGNRYITVFSKHVSE